MAILRHGSREPAVEAFEFRPEKGAFALAPRAISISSNRSVEVGKSAVCGAHSLGGCLFDFPTMADQALNSTPTATLFTGTSLKALIISILIYWGASALLLPVTTSDCQVYNLARLKVAERAGFWEAEAWNSTREVTLPLDVRCGPLSVSENRVGIWHSQFPRLARSPGDYLSTRYSQIWAAGRALVNIDAPVDADPDASSDHN